MIICREPKTGSNCYLIEEDKKALIIDPNEYEPIEKILQERNLTPEVVLLTHEHCDHIRGLNLLREAYPVKVVCSMACSQAIGDITANMSRMMEVYLLFRINEKIAYPPFTCQPAEETYETEHVLRWRGHEFRCIPLPGHSIGSSCIFMDDRRLFSGDYLIPGEQVITRLPGGDEERYIKIAKPWLQGLAEGLEICPGHGDGFILTGKEKEAYGL